MAACIGVSIATALVLLIPTEIIGRHIFRPPDNPNLGCMVLNDPINGPHPIPNSECVHKTPESPVVHYRFNNCGYRSDGQACGPKPAGTYRIALVGTSMVEGLHVPWQQTFAATLPVDLSRKSGQKIDVYDQASEWESPRIVALRLAKTLAGDPDLILWPVTMWDIENASLLNPSKPDPPTGTPFRRGLDRMHREFGNKTVEEAMTALLRHLFEVALPGTTYLLDHYALQLEAPKLTTDSDYLRASYDATWQKHLKDFERYFTEVQTRSRAAGVNVVITLLPTRVQAEFIAQGEWPAGIDPYQLGGQVRATVEKHGGEYLDLLSGFRQAPQVAQDFYPVDGHPNGRGQQVFSRLLVERLSPGLNTLATLHSGSHPTPQSARPDAGLRYNP